MASNSRIARVDPHLVPSPEDAVQWYEQAGGRLTHFSDFGCDPLAGNSHLLHQQEDQSHQIYPHFDPFFHTLVNTDDSAFCDALPFHTDN